MSLRLLQRLGESGKREVIAARGDRATILPGVETVRALALDAIARGLTLAEAIAGCGDGPAVDLAAELDAGRLLAPIDHGDPAHLVLTGTGLTHLGSAEGRDKMHREAAAAEKQTDSMRMFLEGVEGGKPAPGEIGQQPEWFYKGDGSYLIGPDGTPWRLGLCLANEFSDHVTERHNYLWLAHSKLRQAALGAELLVGEAPRDVRGASRILRGGEVVWEKPFLSGEDNMSHSLANLEHHHFKYALFRRPGDIHVHFFGTATLSFSDGLRTQEGDIFEIEAAPFTLPLRNPLARSDAQAVTVRAL